MPEVPEPWLRGVIPDVHPVIMPVFFSFAQVREDLDRHTSGLSDYQLWRQFGTASIGFHLKHISGSVDRLGTYLSQAQLSKEQLQFLQDERTVSGTLAELLAAVRSSLDACEMRLKQLNPDQVFESRTVGRQHLPTTVIGLLTHLAEHTQRHVGQIITLSQVSAAMS